MNVNLGVVRRFVGAEISPKKHAAHNHHQDYNENENVSAALRPCIPPRRIGHVPCAGYGRRASHGFLFWLELGIGCILFGHVYFPLKYSLTPSSATPRARTREIFALSWLYRLVMYCS